MAQPIAYYDPSRQLVRVVELNDVKHHPDADRLDLAVVDGWQVIVGRDKWKKGDKALFCEVGALLPITTLEFIEAARGNNVKTFNELQYARIQSLKLRKEISQGFVCPVPSKFKDKAVGTDLTRELGVLKYEASPTQEQTVGGAELGDRHDTSFIQRVINFIAGDSVSNLLPLPEEHMRRSAEPRAQNQIGSLSRVPEEEDSWEQSVKLDGNSMGIIFQRNTYKPIGTPEHIETRITSRDVEISLKTIPIGFVKGVRLYVAGVLNAIRRKCNGAQNIWWPTFQTELPVANNHFTQMYYNLMAMGLKERIASSMSPTVDVSMCFQGEVIGPGVSAGDRNNYEGVKELEFRVFRLFIDGVEQKPAVVRSACKMLKLQTVPMLDTDFKIRKLYKTDEGSGREYLDITDLLKLAEGPRALTSGGQREGFVLKNNVTGQTVKVISNAFLLKNGDD